MKPLFLRTALVAISVVLPYLAVNAVLGAGRHQAKSSRTAENEQMLVESKYGTHVVPESPKANPIVQIKIEHQGCYGTCPVYTTTLNSDASATYEGKQFTVRQGLFTATFSQLGWYYLKAAFVRDHFDKMPQSVGLAPDIDHETITLKCRNGDKKSVVFCISNASQALWELNALADDVTSKVDWKPATPSLLVASVWDPDFERASAALQRAGIKSGGGDGDLGISAIRVDTSDFNRAREILQQDSLEHHYRVSLAKPRPDH